MITDEDKTFIRQLEFAIIDRIYIIEKNPIKENNSYVIGKLLETLDNIRENKNNDIHLKFPSPPPHFGYGYCRYLDKSVFFSYEELSEFLKNKIIT